MALQGTLDTFALPDVLRLLSSTRKVGRLRVNGEPGSGSLWLEAGMLVGSELLVRSAHAETPVEVLFHLLRFTQGSFMFEAGSVSPATVAERDVESVLIDAELMLGEWRSLEAVVPSLDSWLALTSELNGREAVIDAPRWRIIVSIGSGATVADVGRKVSLGDLAVMRAAKDVIELGLVEVGAPVVAAPPAAPSVAPVTPADPVMSSAPSVVAPPPTVVPVTPPASVPSMNSERIEATGAGVAAPMPAAVSSFERVVLGEPIDPYQPFDREALHTSGTSSWATNSSHSELTEGPMPDDPSFAASFGAGAASRANEMRNGLGSLPTTDERRNAPSVDTNSPGPSEIARQLANLSPRAAKAVAAAAKATTEEERDAALATIEAEDETINRGVLLKFLGAVDG